MAALSTVAMGREGGNAVGSGGGRLADVGAVTRPPSRFYNTSLRERRRVPHMSIARCSCGTCGHGMWTLGSQVVRENGVSVIVPGPPGCGRRVARWPGRARWRRPPRRRRVRALQQSRSGEIPSRVPSPPYHQSYAGKSAGGAMAAADVSYYRAGKRRSYGCPKMQI